MGRQINLTESQFQDLLNAYTKSMEAISNRIYKPWYHLDFLYNLSPTYKADIANFNKINHFMEYLISHKRVILENKENIKDLTKSKDIFIDQIAKYVYNGSISWSDVRDEANVIIAAVSIYAL